MPKILKKQKIPEEVKKEKTKKKETAEKTAVKPPVSQEETKSRPKDLFNVPSSPPQAAGSAKVRDKYFEAVGRRKTAIARVRLFTKGEKSFFINDKNLESYFPSAELQNATKSPLEKMNCLDKFRISAKVKGGGPHAQAEAIRLGIARALVSFNPDFRKRLKRTGYLTRDPRMKERKKFGLKRARRAPQWQKR